MEDDWSARSGTVRPGGVRGRVPSDRSDPVRRAAAAVAVALVLVVTVGCANEDGSGALDTAASIPDGAPSPVWVAEGRTEGVGPDEPVAKAGKPVEVAYGPEPEHAIDVYRSEGESKGTILYIHGGAWVAGSKEDSGSPGARLVLAETLRGWDVVSIGYRLAPQAPGPGNRAPELLADVDRAVRYVRQNADELGVDLSAVVISGGSAGGHLALLHAQGAPTGAFADPDLPAELAAVPATVDAVLAVVAPTDLHTEWMAGGVAPGGQESLLGCTLAEEATIAGMGPCDPAVVDRYSPLWWSLSAVTARQPLPPAYLAYGGADTLVPPDTQGTPNADAWAAAAATNQTWVDLPADGGHDLDAHVNQMAFREWLDRVDSGTWTTSR